MEGHVEKRGKQGGRGGRNRLDGVLCRAGAGDDLYARRGGLLGEGRQDRFRERSNHRSGVHNPTGDYEIFTANRDGKKLKKLTFNTTSDEYPAYSPDGKRIAFETTRDDNYEVYDMNTDGFDPTNLTNNPATDYEPAWQPK